MVSLYEKHFLDVLKNLILKSVVVKSKQKLREKAFSCNKKKRKRRKAHGLSDRLGILKFLFVDYYLILFYKLFRLKPLDFSAVFF